MRETNDESNWCQDFIASNLLVIGYNAWAGHLSQQRGAIVCSTNSPTVGIGGESFKTHFVGRSRLMPFLNAWLSAPDTGILPSQSGEIMQAIDANPVTKLSQLTSQVQVLNVNQHRLNAQANEAKINASNLMIEAEETEIQSKALNRRIKELEGELKEAQSKLSRKQRKELEDYKAGSKSLMSQTDNYNSDLDCIIQEIYKISEKKGLSLIR